MGEMAIIGIGAIPVDRVEYLNRDVVAAFSQQMQVLKTILNKGVTSNYDYPDPDEYVTDYDDIMDAVHELETLAKEGIEVTTASGKYTSYLNQEMADYFNDVMQFLQATGVLSASNDAVSKTNAVKAWQQMAGFGLSQTLTNAIRLRVDSDVVIDTAIRDKSGNILPIIRSPTRTLQSALEIDYIKDGNELLSNNLESFEEAMNVTKKVLDTLTVMQGLYNKIGLVDLTTFTPPTSDSVGNDADAYLSAYEDAAQPHFAPSNSPAVFVYVPGITPDGNTALQLYQAKIDLEALRNQLIQLNSAGAAKSGSLASVIFKVMQDVSTQFNAIGYDRARGGPANILINEGAAAFESTFYMAAYNWILDNQNTNPKSTDVNGAGKIGSRLTDAIKNAESLNDEQRGEVRRYLHLFEEFYKSAVNMLELLGNLLNKISGNVKKQ